MAPYFSFIIILLSTHAIPIFCDNFTPEKTTFSAVKELFSTANYQEALSALLQVKNQNSAVFMLIAECYINLGKRTMAIIYLKKAYVSGNYHQKLQIINMLEQLEEKQLPQGYQELVKKFVCLLDFLPMFLFQFLAFLLLFLLLYVFSHTYIKLFLGFCCFIVVCGVIGVKYSMTIPYGITLHETKIYSAPEDEVPVVGMVAENNIVYYTEEYNLFYKIETADKKRGWVQKDSVMRII